MAFSHLVLIYGVICTNYLPKGDRFMQMRGHFSARKSDRKSELGTAWHGGGAAEKMEPKNRNTKSDKIFRLYIIPICGA